MTGPDREDSDRLWRQAWDAALAGQLPLALDYCEQALVQAKASGETWRVDRTLCNRAAVLIEMGRPQEVKSDLRRVTLRATDQETSFLASYTLARAYEADKDFDKAIFYARIAHGHAQQSGRSEWLSSSHNQLGNAFLAQSKFDQARSEFERALEVLPTELDLRRALALDNLGYCDVVQRRYRQGFTAHFKALRILRKIGARAWLPVVEVSLCFAYLEIGRYRSAIRHAVEALRLAEETDHQEMKKNALFLLGESFKLVGDPLAAREQFARLQREFYPGAEGVADLLLVINVQRMVNIKA